MFSFCSHIANVESSGECAEVESTKAESSASHLETAVDKAIRICGGDVRAALRATLVAISFLEDEVERLTEAISTGFARGCIRKPPKLARN
jgi:hypothetical protein